jgi:hypothetical protein
VPRGRRRFVDFWATLVLANYIKKMEQTRIELSLGFKLLRDRNETKRKELENKVVAAQYEVLDVQNHIHATKEQNRKTLQVKERELNKLQIKLLMENQRKGTLE